MLKDRSKLLVKYFLGILLAYWFSEPCSSTIFEPFRKLHLFPS